MISLFDTQTPGTSRASRFIEEEIGKTRRFFAHLPSHTLALDAVRNEVDRVAKRCKSSNWDGYGAEPVQPATYWYIHAFVDHIPPGIEMPSIGSESDGHMTLEWYRSPERVLSVSVSPEGELHYAALLASERRMGTLKLASSFPEVIYHIIREVTSR